jgi:dihydropteroate synthase
MNSVSAATTLDLGGRLFDVEFRAVVFGVLDTKASRRALLGQADRFVAEGADGLELGSYPYPTPPGGGAEYDDGLDGRVRNLVRRFEVPFAVVTSSAEVVRLAARSGVSIVSDRTGRGDATYFTSVARLGLALIATAPPIGRGLGRPGSPGEADRLLELAGSVRAFLAERAARAEAAGVDRRRILLDAGVDVAAPVSEARHLLQGCSDLVALGYPVVLSTVTAAESPGAGDSAPWPVTAAQAVAIGSGCRVLRTTDVRRARRVADVMAEILAARREGRP